MTEKKTKKSPKALTTRFAPERPTKWYVYVTGTLHGQSADVKRVVHDAIVEAARALPGAQHLTVTAVNDHGGRYGLGSSARHEVPLGKK